MDPGPGNRPKAGPKSLGTHSWVFWSGLAGAAPAARAVRGGRRRVRGTLGTSGGGRMKLGGGRTRLIGAKQGRNRAGPSGRGTPGRGLGARNGGWMHSVGRAAVASVRAAVRRRDGRRRGCSFCSSFCPDAIGAFSLVDSNIWTRHLVSFIFQVGAVVYVFGKIFPSDKSLRLWALYLSNLPRLREWVLWDDHFSCCSCKELTYVADVCFNEEEANNEEEVNLTESIVVKHAYCFFQIFKIFITDFIYTREQRKMSCKYFHRVSAMDALRIISVELQFIYEVLHTKALAIRSKWSYIFRFIAFIDIVMACIMFNRLKKHRLPQLDVGITYCLILGGIALDVISLVMLVFSDWTIAGIKHTTTGSSKLDSFLYKLVSTIDYLRKPRYITHEVEPNTDVTYEFLDTPLIFRRWSESISACNLFSEALKESPRKICKCNQFWGFVVFKNICSFPFQMVDKIISCFLQAGETIARCRGKRSTIANAKYMSKNLFMKKLWIFLFNHVKSGMSSDSEDVMELVKQNQFGTHGLFENVSNANMHNYIIGLHITTEIWYNKDKQSMRSTTPLDPALVDQREFSKILSDYMLYVLLNQPNLMSSVAMVGFAQMVSTKVLLELRSYISNATTDLNEICEELYSDEMSLRAWRGEGPINPLKSPLLEGLLLAHELENDKNKWKIISDMWLKLLQYAAINIKGEAHVQMLSKGGELVTFVWLLMAHVGRFYKPEWGMYREYWEEKSGVGRDVDNQSERRGRDDRDGSDVSTVV
ncbi:uncharacterized protein LOC120292781 [Eucalyptus grandis]|uniref:uncharacterized protein LOC120292781 n=1 Tax=Eucalyptus grandis TaxID=71139 RepID=UPI00192E8D99|nr:uncharacterized protein LOC120292781 [Eucalyptus grandis]